MSVTISQISYQISMKLMIPYSLVVRRVNHLVNKGAFLKNIEIGICLLHLANWFSNIVLPMFSWKTSLE